MPTLTCRTPGCLRPLRSDNRSGYCNRKPCLAAKQRERYARSPEVGRAAAADYRRRNPEKVREAERRRKPGECEVCGARTGRTDVLRCRSHGQRGDDVRSTRRWRERILAVDFPHSPPICLVPSCLKALNEGDRSVDHDNSRCGHVKNTEACANCVRAVIHARCNVVAVMAMDFARTQGPVPEAWEVYLSRAPLSPLGYDRPMAVTLYHLQDTEGNPDVEVLGSALGVAGICLPGNRIVSDVRARQGDGAKLAVLPPVRH